VSLKIDIRSEKLGDAGQIRRVNEFAFGEIDEADLVDALRKADALALSLVAVADGEIVGHLAFSLVIIESDGTSVETIGMGPLAVLPNRQGKGIGSRLVEAGLEELERTDYQLVVVYGHPNFFPRFGFVAAQPHGVVWKKNVPDEFFMVRELKKGALLKICGIVKYRPEFGGV